VTFDLLSPMLKHLLFCRRKVMKHALNPSQTHTPQPFAMGS
jgi:hypothetical protein